MMILKYICCAPLLLLVFVVDIAQPTCVLESDFGFKINCAFKKSGLFRVRNLGGIKAHASLGLSFGDDLGFDQSYTNLDQSRRRSVSVKDGAPPIVDETNKSNTKQEKRGRIMMRPPAPPSRPSQAAMDRLTSLHRRPAPTMTPIMVGPSFDTSPKKTAPSITMAKPVPMGVPPFRPLPPKEDTLSVIPIAVSTKKTYTPLQYPQSKGPGLAYQNPVPHRVHDLASAYVANTKKIDDYNTITGYEDDTILKFNKEDINEKIVEIAKAGNISMEAVEAAIALRQQQLLNKYANLALPATVPSTTSTEKTIVFQPDPEPVTTAPVTQKPKRFPSTGKVMNAPREYYPVGYEKNFDDHFQSKVDLPETNFYCGDQKYFPGLYGDETLGCMVFHVCALTDDGLVMKSFLCPESTLFDQTILKCNWWFYVDCKSTRKLYETNIPVSKSYQLMKALTFFSSYKQEAQEGNAPSSDPDVAGIKEAISILENQNDGKPDKNPNVLQIVTPMVLIDERNNHKIDILNETSPVYRETRNYKNDTSKRPTNDKPKASEDFKLITVNSNLNFSTESQPSNNSNVSVNSTDRKHRRRMTLQQNAPTTMLPTTTTTFLIEVTTPAVEVIKQEILPIESFYVPEVRQETLQDQIEPVNTPLAFEAANSPIKRFYRSSAEKDLSNEDTQVKNIVNEAANENIKEEKEIAIVNNEKVQIVRPTPLTRYVGDFQTKTATALRLDEAVLGNNNSRHKKHVIIVTPQKIQSPPRNNQR